MQAEKFAWREASIVLAKSLSQILLRSICMAIVLAFLASLIGFLRQFPNNELVLPFMKLGEGTTALVELGDSAYSASLFSSFVHWYNMTFPGDARLGSGIGLIAGSFWGLFHIDNRFWVVRLSAGALTGMITGARVALMFTSNPAAFFNGAVIGALIVGTYMAIAAGKRRITPLPIQPLENI